MWEIYTRQQPWRQFSVSWQIAEAIHKGERMPIPTECPPELANLITRCWSFDPDQRPPFSEIYSGNTCMHE